MRVSFQGRGGFFALFFLLALSNCGGGGGGGDDGGGGVVANFVPACVVGNACYNNSVTLQKGTASGNIVTVQAVLNKLNTAIGEASLRLTWDPADADYQSFSQGPAFGTTAQGGVYLVTENPSGQLFIDITNTGGSKTLTSAQVMITLTFKVLRVGDTNINPQTTDSISGSALFQQNGSIIPLGSAGWSGGLLSGT